MIYRNLYSWSPRITAGSYLRSVVSEKVSTIFNVISYDVSTLSHKYPVYSLRTNLTHSSFTTNETLSGQILKQKFLFVHLHFHKREKCMVILMQLPLTAQNRITQFKGHLLDTGALQGYTWELGNILPSNSVKSSIWLWLWFTFDTEKGLLFLVNFKKL